MVTLNKEENLNKVRIVLRPVPKLESEAYNTLENLVKGDNLIRGFYDEVRFLYDFSHIVITSSHLSFYGDSGLSDFTLPWDFFCIQSLPYLICSHFNLSDEEELGIRSLASNIYAENPQKLPQFFTSLVENNKDTWYANRNRDIHY